LSCIGGSAGVPMRRHEPPLYGCGSSYASEERLLSELRRLRQIDADA
jgi:hypothetical protein